MNFTILKSNKSPKLYHVTINGGKIHTATLENAVSLVYPTVRHQMNTDPTGNIMAIGRILKCIGEYITEWSDTERAIRETEMSFAKLYYDETERIAWLLYDSGCMEDDFNMLAMHYVATELTDDEIAEEIKKTTATGKEN